MERTEHGKTVLKIKVKDANMCTTTLVRLNVLFYAFELESPFHN